MKKGWGNQKQVVLIASFCFCFYMISTFCTQLRPLNHFVHELEKVQHFSNDSYRLKHPIDYYNSNLIIYRNLLYRQNAASDILRKFDANWTFVIEFLSLRSTPKISIFYTVLQMHLSGQNLWVLSSWIP